MRIPLSNESHKSVYVCCIHKKCNSKKENKTENLSKDALQKTQNFNKLQFTQNDQTDLGDQTDQTDQTNLTDKTNIPTRYITRGVVRELSNMQNYQSPVSISESVSEIR